MPVHPSYPRAVQLIMLTGQRVEEIARLHVDQWDAKEKIIDWSKTKNPQPHAVPVSSLERPTRASHAKCLKEWKLAVIAKGRLKELLQEKGSRIVSSGVIDKTPSHRPWSTSISGMEERSGNSS